MDINIGDSTFDLYDWEDIPISILTEYDSTYTFVEARQLVAKQSGDSSLFTVWVENVLDCDISDKTAESLEEEFYESYIGTYDTKNDYAYELAENNGWLRAMEAAGMNVSYFDVKAFLNDLEYSGEVLLVEVFDGYAAFYCNT